MAQFLEFFGNHTGLFVAAGVVLAMIAANEVFGAVTGGKRLSVPDAIRLINDREPIILDVRTQADFRKGHLLNAHNAPLAKLDEHLGPVAKDKSRPILVYCNIGGTASAAAERLRKGGFTEVYQMRGGINAWTGANLPLTTK